VDGVPYTWDDNGNLLSNGVRAYNYDHANRLISVSGAGSTVSYAYNGLGDRLQETVGGETTHFLFNFFWKRRLASLVSSWLQ
jgi:YD repeat-containing protein